MIDLHIAGRVALVTGGNHGIGAAIARALAAQAARVFINYLRLPPQNDSALPRAYGEALALSADGVVGAIQAAGGMASRPYEARDHP